MITDSELLRQYADQGNEAAFAGVVRRHTDLVYSAALRIARDTTLAQDVTQTVFTKLARVARMLGGYPTPIGWLHTTTRHTAINAVRAEARRRTREHEAFTMQNISALPDANWELLRPILDEAVGRLRERDRQAVLLRFFNGLSHQEVGTVLGLTENSAQKCVDRALEKLRVYFARRGVTVSAALLATAMSVNSVQAAPVGLAANVAKTSTLGAGSGASFASAILLAFYMSTKIKTVAVIAIIVVILGGIWWFARPMNAAPEKAAQATMPTKADAPKSLIHSSVVESPKALAVPAKDDTTAISLAADTAQADLKTAIPDLARMTEAGDLAGLYEKYAPPGKLNSKKLQLQQKTEEEIRHLVDISSPSSRFVQHILSDRAAGAQSWVNMEAQTPTYNAAGDEATYMRTDADLRIPGDTPPLTYPMTFIKINGKWYIKYPEPNDNPNAP